MSSGNSAMRVSDSEREQMADTLGRHLVDGRLTMGEFETRLDVVYSATTRGELDVVLADLPSTEPAPRSPQSRQVRSPAQAWAPWALTGAICVLIWVTTSLIQGRPLGFWPVWVIGPWGVVLLARTMGRRCTPYSS